ncbi:MAG: hypothetical protein AB7T49_12800 [Oligoflexales bacterium]
MTLNLALFFFLLLWQSRQLPAGEKTDIKQDHREICRVALSGQFMELQNDLSLLEDRLQLSKGYIEDLEKAVALQKKKIAKVKELLTIDKYNPELEDKRTGFTHELERFENDLAEKKRLQSETAKNLAETQSAKSEFTSKLKKVFLVRELGINKESGYSIGLEYLTECNRYQYLCPLPPEQREALKKVLPKDKLPESCLNYTTIAN